MSASSQLIVLNAKGTNVRAKVSTTVLLSPLLLFGYLQSLDLLPAYPVLPHPGSLVPFSSSSPFQIPYRSTHAGPRICTYVLSPTVISALVLWWLASWTNNLERKLQKYIRAALPRPDIPDVYSVQGAMDSGFETDIIPGITNFSDTIRESRSITEELAKDLQTIGRNFQIFRDKVGGLLSRNQLTFLSGILFTLHHEQRPSTFCAPSPTEGTNLPTPTLTTHRSQTFSPLPESHGSISSTPSPSRPSSPRPLLEINTSTITGDTLHMDLSIPAPDNNSPPIYNTRFSNSPRPTGIGTDYHGHYTHHHHSGQHGPHHRVTALTTYPVTIMAGHLSEMLADLIFLPVQSMFLRILALAFLSSPPASLAGRSAAARWKGEIYPIGGWCGMGLRGGWRGMGDYAVKVMLMAGLEAGVRLGFWQVGTALRWFIGKRNFGWGRL